MVFLRGVGKVVLFSISGLIMSLSTLISTIIFIVWLKLGVIGFLISMIIALLITMLTINFNISTFKYIKISKIDWKMSKKLLQYSIPLMPNSLMWWVINASSRYFILIFAGANFNGLFAVASKVPSVLSLFNTIFFKAWQLSAIEEYGSKNKNKIFSSIFNYYQQFLFIVLGTILLFLKVIFKQWFGDVFYSSWQYVPFLLVGVLFSSFSSFLGTNYIASKQTSGVFKTSIIGGVTSIVVNVLMIPLFGVIGASISSMCSFMVMAITRVYDTKKYIYINYNYKNILINFGLIVLKISVLYLNFKQNMEFTILLLIFVFLLINNKKIIMQVLKASL